LLKTFNKKPITERIKFYEIHGLSKKHLYIIISKEISNFIFININLNNYAKLIFKLIFIKFKIIKIFT